MKNTKKLMTLILSICLLLTAIGCGTKKTEPATSGNETVQESTADISTEQVSDSAADVSDTESESANDEQTPVPQEKNGDVIILFTSDVHCGINQGFGYAGLYEIRKNLEAKGYTTLLVDDGDSVQGEAIGTLTDGEQIIDLMNAMQYDVAIPGNHEYDYGMDAFFKNVEKADFPYISCNFNKEGQLMLDPYVIIEAAGKKIAFVGITTPRTLTSSTPKYFMDENGQFVYGFMQDEDGSQLYDAVQKAVDDARAEGADYVYALAHLGMDAEDSPWTYVDVISHTNGIDVFYDGHSHDTEQVVMKNKDGEDVIRSACGTKLQAIGHSLITKDGEISDAGIWTWSNDVSAPELLGINNEISKLIDDSNKKLSETLDTVVSKTSFSLVIYDPVATDNNGQPIRIVRSAETNLGDMIADGIKSETGADIAFMNGGGIRVNIEKGDITYGDIINVLPFGNMICMIEATGQQILDALEWGSRAVPAQNGGFLQTSGLSYEIDTTVDSGCIESADGFFEGYEGPHRVKNVMVGDSPLDLEKTYTVGGIDYILLQNGDGYTVFEGCNVLQESIKLDNQSFIDYILEQGDEINEVYAEPYGQGRITIIE